MSRAASLGFAATPPPFAISYPDGQGGWITVGTIAPPSKLAAAPTGMQWAQYGSTVLSILVAVATLYIMFHQKGVRG